MQTRVGCCLKFWSHQFGEDLESVAVTVGRILYFYSVFVFVFSFIGRHDLQRVLSIQAVEDNDCGANLD